ncbi:HAD domain-containing protein [Nocardiopsis nanhaiensis]
MSYPLLFIDIDGPLNPFRATPSQLEGYSAHRMRPPGWERPARPLSVWLNPAHGEELLALPYELVWASTWEHAANTMIGPVLGLPELPVVEMPRRPARHWGLFFKTPAIVDYAGGRPFAWVDDGITGRDRSWVDRNHLGDALLCRIDPAIGLWEKDFDLLADWPPAVAAVEESE